MESLFNRTLTTEAQSTQREPFRVCPFADQSIIGVPVRWWSDRAISYVAVFIGHIGQFGHSQSFLRGLRVSVVRNAG